MIAGSASAATLTIAPDKSTYLVGETITLSVFGDAEGAAGTAIFGRLLFDGGLAGYVGSSQEVLTSFGGGVVWIIGPLFGGVGFADAFNQGTAPGEKVPDDPLAAEVVLRAVAPGILGYAWLTAPSNVDRLRFFGLTNAPGGSVTIVPEPSTLLLIGLGLLVLGRIGKLQ